MKIKPNDLMISNLSNESKFVVYHRVRFLFFFYKWELLTFAETDSLLEEKPIEFNSLDEAIKFCKNY